MKTKIKVKKLGVILTPTKRSFERLAVLNPAVYQDGNTLHIFYRAVSRNYKSTIGYAKLEGPTHVTHRATAPIISRNNNYESKGVEDPRIVKIDDTFYLTYVAHDGKNAVTALATSWDLQTFAKKGIITPQITYDEAAKFFGKTRLKDRYFMFEAYYEEFAGKDVLLWDKDVVFFPKKINKNFAMIHRILPDMQIVYFKELKDLASYAFWKNYLQNLSKYVILENKYWFESRNIGGGAPPVETDSGWLLIFHAVEELNKSRIYHASAALLDRDDPTKIIGRLDTPLISPEEPWETQGFVNNIVFPTGTAQFGSELYIYYGAADKRIAVASVNLHELIRVLKNSKK